MRRALAIGIALRRHTDELHSWPSAPPRDRWADEHWPALQRRVIELLNRRVERIHIGVSDNPGPSPL
jgi:hypothetical protein